MPALSAPVVPTSLSVRPVHPAILVMNRLQTSGATPLAAALALTALQ